MGVKLANNYHKKRTKNILYIQTVIISTILGERVTTLDVKTRKTIELCLILISLIMLRINNIYIGDIGIGP